MKKLLLAVVLAALALSVFASCGRGDDEVRIHLLGLTDDAIANYTELGTMGNPGQQFGLGVRNAILDIEGIGDVIFEDWGWAETLDSRQRAAIAAGDHPHIVGGEVFMPSYALDDLLLPLPQDIVDRVVETFLIRNPRNEPVAVAIGGTVFMLFYNYDLMAQAGFYAPPTTWDEWQMMSDAITAVGNGEFWGGGVPSFPHAGGALRATPFFRMQGVDFFQNGRLMLDDPRIHSTLQFIRDMNRNLPPGLGDAADEGPLWTAFNNQQIAFGVDGTWRASYLEREGVNWGVTTLPLPAGGVPGNCLVGVTFVGVPRGASDTELSFNIIRAALREDVSVRAIPQGRVSPLRSIHHNERARIAAEGAHMVVAYQIVYEGGFGGLVVFPRNSAEVWDIVNTMVIARTTQSPGTPIETITSEAIARINPLLN
ncbi:MAG: extracellular solute-binding protein [Defluviitaleaceae bacterium]|nr:extracellular solute-binding protein [Defluviitaleaceae bacterium]MCL2240266.1 extracellular solute-binding protein [Defluviitaleaceae bacterium]